jgi:hypothetical protein
MTNAHALMTNAHALMTNAQGNGNMAVISMSAGER